MVIVVNSLDNVTLEVTLFLTGRVCCSQDFVLVKTSNVFSFVVACLAGSGSMNSKKWG